ncbi:MAG: urease accessory protein UreD [Ginsengibacter sp.]
MPVDHHLDIVAGFKNNKTFLQTAFCQQPFQLRNITEDKSDSWLRLMITSSSPGVLDNDHYKMRFLVEQEAKVSVSTQGYQRIFTMTNNASQQLAIEVMNGGSFTFLPHPVVPHASSSFSSANIIYLQQQHHLIWSDIITCGRKLSGEQFRFTRLHTVTSIYIEDKMVVRDNIFMEPAAFDIQGLGHLEGYTHQATFIFLDDVANMNDVSDQCYEILTGVEEIDFGLSLLQVNGLVIRILGNRAEQLFELNKTLAAAIG